jgi:hypothetical protein
MVGTARSALVPTISADRTLSERAGGLAQRALLGDEHGYWMSVGKARSGSNRDAANGRREQGSLGEAVTRRFVARRQKAVPRLRPA